MLIRAWRRVNPGRRCPRSTSPRPCRCARSHAADGRGGSRVAASSASTGRAHVDFLGDLDAARTSYGETAYARLVALTDEWDPANVLRLNQTIEPSAG